MELKEDELKRPGQALMGKSGVGPSDYESARGWPDFVMEIKSKRGGIRF